MRPWPRALVRDSARSLSRPRPRSRRVGRRAPPALLVAAALVAGLVRVAHAGGGVVIPPLRLELGQAAPLGRGAGAPATTREALIGVHWASLAWRPTAFDVGVGVVSSRRELADDGGLARGAGASPAARELNLTGGYLEVGRVIADGPAWRTWLAVRGEVLRGALDGGAPARALLGEAVRLGTELFSAGAFGAGRAGVVGTIAVGVYAEVSHRALPARLGATALAAGLSLRVPFLFAD